MPSYSSALSSLASDIRPYLERKLKSKKKFQLHCLSIQDTYVRIFVTKADVPASPMSQHKGTRFIEITQSKHDQDLWQVGYGHDLASDEPFRMVGYFYPKKSMSSIEIARHANNFFASGNYPVMPVPNRGLPN